MAATRSTIIAWIDKEIRSLRRAEAQAERQARHRDDEWWAGYAGGCEDARRRLERIRSRIVRGERAELLS